MPPKQIDEWADRFGDPDEQPQVDEGDNWEQSCEEQDTVDYQLDN